MVISDTQTMIMLAIALWVPLLAYASCGVLSDFYARKLCHAGCGLGMMLLDSKRLDCRLFVWAVAATSIAMTWNVSPLPPFRFARAHDVGITVYLTLVSFWFFLQLPPTILAPMFFADPAGAVVCRACIAAVLLLPHSPLQHGTGRQGRHTLSRASIQSGLV